MAVRYKNDKTGKIATYAQSNPRLEKSKTWRRVAEAKPRKADDKPREDKPGG